MNRSIYRRLWRGNTEVQMCRVVKMRYGNHCAEGCDTGQVMNLKLSETHLLPLL